MRGLAGTALIGVIVAVGTLPASSESQAAPALRGEWAIEQQLLERWLHGGQLARFVRFKTHSNWITVDSLRGDETGHRIYLTLGRTAAGRDSALIFTDRMGRLQRLHVGMAPFFPSPLAMAGDSLRWLQRQRFRFFDGGLALPESRLWDVMPTFARGAARVGLRWTDTIAQVATDGPFFGQSVRGTRVSRIRGDTVVDGRRHWIVQDSAQVEYQERYAERDRTLDTTVHVSRSVSGVVRGVYLYDPKLGLALRRDDTTSLSGDAVLRYADGREYRTPARYERTRRWDLYDPARYAGRVQQLRDESRRRSGGMVVVPNDLERRLLDGDVQARDSLFAVWVTATDAENADRLFGLLTNWMRGRDTAFTARLDSIRVAAGDTAHLYDRLASRALRSGNPVDTADVRAMLKFMEDPALLWRFNLSRDHLHENLAQALTSWPRAAIALNVTYAACTIPACDMLAAKWRGAADPRTRDVGLVALFSVDPARWADTVLALDGPRRPLLRRAAMLAKGIGATWPAASKAVMPPPNSDWRVWLEWMDGRDSAYVAGLAAMWAARPPGAPDRMLTDTIAKVRFEESHRTAIRMYTASTGRDIAAELQRAYAAAESDSARLVLGTMLRQLGLLRLGEEEIAEAFASRDPARVALARDALVANFGSASRLIEPEGAAPFIDHLIAVELGSAQSWRALIPRVQRNTPPPPPPPGARTPRPEKPLLLINSQGIPEAVRAKWSGRVEFISPAQLRQRDPREARSFYTFGPVRAWGRFVGVEVNASGTLARSANESPHHYAWGSTYYLMELNGEWVVVEASGWIT